MTPTIREYVIRVKFWKVSIIQHHQRRTGMATRPRPSFDMTTTKTLGSVFSWRTSVYNSKAHHNHPIHNAASKYMYMIFMCILTWDTMMTMHERWWWRELYTASNTHNQCTGLACPCFLWFLLSCSEALFNPSNGLISLLSAHPEHRRNNQMRCSQLVGRN